MAVHKHPYSVALFRAADGQIETWSCPADEAGLVEQLKGPARVRGVASLRPVEQAFEQVELRALDVHLQDTNPLTGGPTMATMECSLLSLAEGRRTRAYRSNSNSAFIVVAGAGRSEIGETTLEWRKHDIVSLPHGHWIGHTAETEGAHLFEVSDREMLKRLHILRDEFAD